VPELDSTNAHLRRELDRLPEGATVVADAQTAGRGRLRREWHSPAGVNLYVSILLKPAMPPFRVPELALVAAAAVLGTVDAAGVSGAGVKWPNDILWQGRKLAGILCELEAEMDLVHGVIIGIGLDVNLQKFPPELAATATSLRRILGHPVSRPALLADLLNRLEAGYTAWQAGGLAATVALLNARSLLAGQEVRVVLPAGELRGRAGRITATGALELALPDGTRTEINSGEVLLCRPTKGTHR